MASKSKYNTRKDEVKKDEAQASGSLADITTLTMLLEEHRAVLSSEFKSAFSTLEAKLDTLHTTVNDHEQRLLSLEANADASSTKDLVIREARKQRGKLQYRGTQIFINEDYSPEVLEMRAEYRVVMKELYTLGMRPSLHYPSKLFITTSDGKKKQLPSVQEAREFLKAHRRETMEAT
ncbi:LINE-1 type transposase domain-containing 1 [Labeo rohita]|uniref:LINE-1 type transposase domain-containing 1 n=1 Tax=Labeo rohita TaxID=84645 RepID=A0A498M3C5_LABRO|nr:LINE-1 type transposase domain-containing 1 [Labeo rohita]